MRRSGALSRDPAKAAEWQRRSRERQREADWDAVSRVRSEAAQPLRWLGRTRRLGLNPVAGQGSAANGEPSARTPDKAASRSSRAGSARRRPQTIAPQGDGPDGKAAGPLPRSGRARRRNDAPWRTEVLATYGPVCVACGDVANVQADHVIPRAQGGPSDVRNGLPLCGEFSRVTAGGCHPAKTAGRLRIRYEWLTAGQRAFLADAGWVAWDWHGRTYGRGWRHFEDRQESTG